MHGKYLDNSGLGRHRTAQKRLFESEVGARMVLFIHLSTLPLF